MHWWPLNRPQAPADVAATQRSTATSLPNQLQGEPLRSAVTSALHRAHRVGNQLTPNGNKPPAGSRRTRVDLHKHTAKPPHIKVTARCPRKQQQRVTDSQSDKGNRSSRHHSAGCSRMALERSTMRNPGRWWAVWHTVNSKVKVDPSHLTRGTQAQRGASGAPSKPTECSTDTHCQLADPANSTAPTHPADPCRQDDDPPEGAQGKYVAGMLAAVLCKRAVGRVSQLAHSCTHTRHAPSPGCQGEYKQVHALQSKQKKSLGDSSPANVLCAAMQGVPSPWETRQNSSTGMAPCQ